jgi:hypothetical protein
MNEHATTIAIEGKTLRIDPWMRERYGASQRSVK